MFSSIAYNFYHSLHTIETQNMADRQMLVTKWLILRHLKEELERAGFC